MPPAPAPSGNGLFVGLESMPATITSLLNSPFTDALAWVAIAGFLVAVVLQWQNVRDGARYLAAGSWVVFGLFWLTMVPYFYYDAQSPLETVLALAALPLCVYTGYLLYAGRESLLLLSKAVAIMGLIYLPAELIPVVQRWLIETTAVQTHYGMELLGYSPGIEEGSNGYYSRFAFDPEETVTGRTTHIVLACTGIGSMAIFGGLTAAVKAPLRRKAVAFVASIGIIWFLNLIRNVFISLSSPYGWFQFDWLVSLMTTYLGSQPDRVSYLVAHNYVAQPLSVVALVAITYFVVKILPEVLEPLEDVLFVFTGNEYDLFEALGYEDARPGTADSEQ
ncbi:archaeosortase A [Halopiger goleimassiliensis]|uniref:archaeosortase A n=1 Tax=Halopiger goleimassiliensis TaxID=1293048 RepID=UPI0006780322